MNQQSPIRGRVFYCGQDNLLKADPGAHAEATLQLGDLVQVEAYREFTSVKRGDVIAIEKESGRHIKRLIGIPGDVISVGRSREILVNDQPAHRVLASRTYGRCPVDFDSRRPKSRWRSVESSGWTRVGTNWQFVATSPSPWLFYHHTAADKRNLPSPVYDDWPSNVGLRREMSIASDLEVDFTMVADQAYRIEAVLWTASESLTTFAEVDQPGSGGPAENVTRVHLRFGGTPTSSTLLPVVSAERPIALRFVPRAGVASKVQLSDLQVTRRIGYRLRRRDCADRYPITLSKNQYFVCGDNIPISTDSRVFGPIDRSQILGCIRRVLH